MTHFLDRVTEKDEKIICRARLHWIYIMTGLLWLAGLAGAGFYLDLLLWENFGTHIPTYRQDIMGLIFGAKYPWLAWMFSAVGVMIAAIHITKVIATEIALTDQRVIYKTGLFFVDVKEIDLAEIRAESVHHGLLGRFLRYGEVHLDSRFVGDIYLPAMSKPYRLLKAIHTARRKLHDPLDE